MFHSATTNHFHQLARREYGLSSSLKPSSLEKNIYRGNCTKTLFNQHNRPIIKFDVQGQYAVTAAKDRKVILWNLFSKKIVWIRDYDLWDFSSYAILKIAERCLILASRNIDEGKSIKILDLENGIETATINIPDMSFGKICVVGERIFVGLSKPNHMDYGVEEWTTKGTRIRRLTHTPKQSYYAPIFIGSDDFVVDISLEENMGSSNIFIHHLKDNVTNKIKTYPITAACINGEQLFCTVSTKQKNAPNYTIMNMKTNQTTREIIFLSHVLHAKLTEIQKIVAREDQVYLGYSNGAVIRCHLVKKSHFLMGRHSSKVTYLALKGNLLISASIQSNTEVYFWDVRSKKKVGTMIHPTPLLNFRLTDHQLFATDHGTLIEWDYLKKEKTATEMKKNSADCVIL